MLVAQAWVMDQDGIVMHGIPIGSRAFISSHFQLVTERAIAAARRVVNDVRLDMNEKISLIRACVSSRLVFMSQVTHPDVHTGFLEMYDTALRGMMPDIFGRQLSVFQRRQIMIG